MGPAVQAALDTQRMIKDAAMAPGVQAALDTQRMEELVSPDAYRALTGFASEADRLLKLPMSWTQIDSGRAIAQANSRSEDQLRQAMSAFADCAWLSSSLVKGALSLDVLARGLTTGLAEAGTAFSAAVGDLTAIESVLDRSRSGIYAISAGDLLKDTAKVGRTVDEYLRYSVGQFREGDIQLDRAYSLSQISVPATASRAYVESVSAALGVRDGPMRLGSQGPPVAQLGEVFSRLGRKFSRKWEGAWMALESGNPDRLSHAADSGVELLMQGLEELAPNSCFSPEEIARDGHEGRVTRRMRIKHITTDRGSAAVAWCDAIADGLVAMHSHLEGVHHYRGEPPAATEQEVAGLLIAMGGLFMVLTGSR